MFSSNRLSGCLLGLVTWVNAFTASAVEIPSPGPVLLDDRFDLPPGFHVYRAAEPELTGGSYDIAFDGEGRVLVGDGNAIRRLNDDNGDGVFDRFEILATGLGWRGPQGLLVWGDRLYAVGGDGLQWYKGYQSGTLVHQGRLGQKFLTGGDHDLHTVLRGYDGHLYLMAGNGAGIEGRKHITDETSPVRFEREASVFRLDPDGRRWECIAAGGRNPPGLGLNHLGELFSFDSDMEWHVGLPFYRPIQLNHWAMGTDQGWQEVGANRRHFIDSVEPVMTAGRGSPNWGVFYEHDQLPARYRHAFLNCDYRWKRESDDQYASSGRLVAFFLKRAGAGWSATVETLARPKPGARDARERPINFALVDVDVAPDGSLLVSDHNQGLWRIYHDVRSGEPKVPVLVPKRGAMPGDLAGQLTALLRLPQPLSEWSRLREDALLAAGGTELRNALYTAALDGTRVPLERVRCVQLLAPGVAGFAESWIRDLAKDVHPEIRAQAAWLLGLRADDFAWATLLKLTEDLDDLVRRRAVESLGRARSPRIISALITRLDDSSRLTRFIAMNALTHHPVDRWLDLALAQPGWQPRLRALVALRMRGETVAPSRISNALRSMLDRDPSAWSREDRLDLLRIINLNESIVTGDLALRNMVERHLLADFPAHDPDVRWEQTRLIGLFRVVRAFGPIWRELAREMDGSTRFHLAQALARLPAGWAADEESASTDWFVGTQRGWFAEFGTKGVEFPQYWSTTLLEFASHHQDAWTRRSEAIDINSLPGGALIDLLVGREAALGELTALYRRQTSSPAKARVAAAFSRVVGLASGEWLRNQLNSETNAIVRRALARSLAGQPVDPPNVTLLTDGLRDAGRDDVLPLAEALERHRPAPTRELVRNCLDQMAANVRLVAGLERLLVTISGRQRPGYQADRDPKTRVEDSVRQAALQDWARWYQAQFGEAYQSAGLVAPRERSDEELQRWILGDAAKGGSARRGAAVYERLQCHNCHGGGSAPGREGRIFGPDLAGVTRRMSRHELAEALVYPSRQVADRFKAIELEKKDGTILTGFVTEKNDDAVTLATQQSVERVSRGEIARLAPQTNSLMPAQLMNTLTDEELRDLLTYLDRLGQPLADQ